jgi:hypothetical protein
MVFWETFAVYCENNTEQTDNVWAECIDCTSQETHYVSTTKSNRLMLFGETVADYCEKNMEHTDTLCGQNVEFVPHRNHITSPLQRRTR